jgi:hypothetical protein
LSNSIWASGPSALAISIAIIGLSQAHPRYGYRRITALLRRADWEFNPKRVARVRRQEGFRVSKRQRKMTRLGTSTGLRQRATRPNEVWSWDFVEDQTEGGGKLRMLTLIDEYTRQCLAVHVSWSIRAVDAITVVEAAMERYGVPEHLRSDSDRSSSRMPSKTGSSKSRSKPSISNRAARGKTATLKASTTSSGMNASTAKSSVRSWKPKCWSNNGGWNIIPKGLTARCGTRLRRGGRPLADFAPGFALRYVCQYDRKHQQPDGTTLLMCPTSGVRSQERLWDVGRILL